MTLNEADTCRTYVLPKLYNAGSEDTQIQVKKFTEYIGESVRSMYPSAAELRAKWSDAAERAALEKPKAYRLRNWRR